MVCPRAHVRPHMLAGGGLQGPLPMRAVLLTGHVSYCLQAVHWEGRLVCIRLIIVQVEPSSMQPALT